MTEGTGTKIGRPADMARHCPRCGYGLVPVHDSEKARRRVLYYSCPEPYCDHVQSSTPLRAPTRRLRAAARGR